MKYYIVDAFADKVFKGNPAGVCILKNKISKDVMQSIYILFVNLFLEMQARDKYLKI